MTQILKSWAYINAGVDLEATIDYDYPKNSGIIFTYKPDAPVSVIITMTTQDVTDWINNQVASRRTQMEQQAADEILDPIQNVDIEP